MQQKQGQTIFPFRRPSILNIFHFLLAK